MLESHLQKSKSWYIFINTHTVRMQISLGLIDIRRYKLWYILVCTNLIKTVFLQNLFHPNRRTISHRTVRYRNFLKIVILLKMTFLIGYVVTFCVSSKTCRLTTVHRMLFSRTVQSSSFWGSPIPLILEGTNYVGWFKLQLLF